MLVGRDPAKLDATLGDIKRRGGSAEPFPADLRDWDRVAELAAHCGEGIDLLVNSAGGQFAAPSSELTRNGWQAVMDTNLNGAFFLLRHLQPAFARRRGAAVMVVADIWRKPAPGLAHSAAARAGVVSLVRTLALEWASEGVRVNAVSPGFTDTPALDRRYAPMLGSVPLGRIGQVDEVVDAVLFLGSATYITGEVLTIDGGLHLV